MAARSLLVGTPLEEERPAKAVNPPAALPAQGNAKTVGRSAGLNKIGRGDSAITPWVHEDKDGRLDLQVDLTGVPGGKKAFWHCAVWFFFWNSDRFATFKAFRRALNFKKGVKVDHVGGLPACTDFNRLRLVSADESCGLHAESLSILPNRRALPLRNRVFSLPPRGAERRKEQGWQGRLPSGVGSSGRVSLRPPADEGR